jgi:hypothetical protein
LSVAWEDYWAVLRRRWWIVAVILVVDVLASGYSYEKSAKSLGSQACLTLYVSDVGAPSLVAVSSDLLDTVGQQLAGETAANFFADDILDISQGGRVGAYMSAQASRQGLSNAAAGDLGVSGSRKDRTVSLCVANPSSATALAAGKALAGFWTSRSNRANLMGPVGKRIDVTVISDPSVGPVPRSASLKSLGLRLALGVIVAVGVALLWDALDPGRRPLTPQPPLPPVGEGE